MTGWLITAVKVRPFATEPGDAFVFYTDGLTACGPSHQELLGAHGMTELLRQGSHGTANELLE